MDIKYTLGLFQENFIKRWTSLNISTTFDYLVGTISTNILNIFSSNSEFCTNFNVTRVIEFCFWVHMLRLFSKTYLKFMIFGRFLFMTVMKGNYVI